MSTQTFLLERIQTITGPMLMVTDDQQRLRALDWEDHEARMHRLFERGYGPDSVRLREVPRGSAAARALEAYFEGELEAVAHLPTATQGTTFQRAVWAALRGIPAGQTLSYGALAARLGQPTAARAVGMANGSNPIAIVVPCHRVIGANASLTGYGGGVERKRWLLAHERSSQPVLGHGRAPVEKNVVRSGPRPAVAAPAPAADRQGGASNRHGKPETASGY